MKNTLKMLAIVAAVAATTSLTSQARDVPAIADAIYASNLALVEQLNTESDTIDNDLDGFGTTPLMLAAIRGETPIVASLLRAGAHVNLVNYRGVSALSAAVRSCRGTLETVRLLISAGADIENRSGADMTPLLAAIQDERPDVAMELIKSGADVNALNQYGDGVLTLAIHFRLPDIYQMAIARGAELAQLKLLYTNDIYYYPGFGRVRPHCVRNPA